MEPTEELQINDREPIREISELYLNENDVEDFDRGFTEGDDDLSDETEEKIEKKSKLATEVNEPSENNRVISVEATYYTAECKGCIGITKSGVDVRDTVYYEGKRIVAVDPEVIPLGTEVIVRTDNGEEFAATAQDIGSAIKGKRIDILVETKAEANRLGRVGAEVEIIDEE